MKDARAATRSGSGIRLAARAVLPLRRSARTCLLSAAASVALTAAPLAAQCPPPLHPPVIELLSQTVRGMAAEGRSEGPAVNLNGLVAAYSSDAIDLVNPVLVNPRNEVYAREIDVVTSERVSVAPDGKPGNLPSQASGFPPGISAEGRYVAFSSLANNLVPGDTNNREDVFVYDRVADAMELISRGIDGPSQGVSSLPKISGDGRYVVFQSTATNLVADPGNTTVDVYLYDRVDQVMHRVSVASDGTPGNGDSVTPNISDDGLVVGFASSATNLVAQQTNGVQEIFVREWQAGTTELISVSSAGAPGNGTSFLPALSRDGSQVAFKSEAFNLVPGDGNGVPDVFVRDRPNGTTQRVSVDDFGNEANGLSGGPGISGDGRFVAFASFASNFVCDDGNGFSDIFVYDRFPPGVDHGLIARVTVGMNGEDPNEGVSDFPVTISSDGRWVGFASSASNLVPNDFNSSPDAFLGCNPFDEFQCAPPTATPTVTPTATPTVEDIKPCVGDCDGDGMVSVGDLIHMVSIALGLSSICPDGGTGCLAGDATCDCEITVDELIRAVQNSLLGCHDFGACSIAQEEQMCCAEPPDTRTPTGTRTPTPTPPVTPTPEHGPCVGDCDGNGSVGINELIAMVSIDLGLQPLCPDGTAGCLAGDADCDCSITVDDLVKAVLNSLNTCTTFTSCSMSEHTMICCEG